MRVPERDNEQGEHLTRSLAREFISIEDFNKLKELEESLWLSVTRFDQAYMNRILSPDFFEFGLSGRIYNREETLTVPPQEIKARLPLKDFSVHLVDTNVFLVTYISEVMYDELEMGNRSSLWLKTPTSWQLRFHQGTPLDFKDE